MMHRTVGVALVALACNAMTYSSANAASAQEIDAKVKAALTELLSKTPEAKEIADEAAAVLVFPEIIKGGALVGGMYGEGALVVEDNIDGYYVNLGASYGLQLGVQSFAYFMFLMSQDGIDYLHNTEGWDVGTAPTLVWGSDGWSEGLSVQDIEEDIIVFFADQSGLMAGAGLQGTTIEPFEPD